MAEKGSRMTLEEQLEELEGRRRHAYVDSLGFLSIGIGRLIDKRKGGGLSDDEIDYLFQNDIRDKKVEVFRALPWVKTLNEPRQAVILGMAFQMGTDGLLKFKNTLKAVEEGRWDDAKAGMLNSKWARQTPERAQRLAEQMLTGEWK